MIKQHAQRRGKALTAAFIRSVKKPGKYHDGGGLGLYLRVEANGSRFWVQRITIIGKRREIGLGSPPLISLAVVRDKAIDNKRLALAGGDPIQAKRKSSSILTFEDSAREFHALNLPTWKNKKHGAQFLSTLETYAFPLIGTRNIADLESQDILAVLKPIWIEKPETARRVKQRIGAILEWSIAQGWRTDNPARSLTKVLPKHDKTINHRKALPYQDVAGCIKTVKESGAGESTKLALEFLILTAARSGETRGAKWAEIDLNGDDSATWAIPSIRMKMKKAHRVPLSPRAVEILNEAKNLDDGSGLVFPSTWGKELSDATLSKLVKELGFDVHIHGFRTSFRTWTQEQSNAPREVAEAALAHVIKDKSEAAYARSDLFDKRRKMMESWAGYLAVKRGEVVRLETGKGRGNG